MIIFSFYNDVEEPNGMILKAYDFCEYMWQRK